jgi:hypothetical protein
MPEEVAALRGVFASFASFGTARGAQCRELDGVGWWVVNLTCLWLVLVATSHTCWQKAGSIKE